uniref:Uncharacterized protein n=1 Tax=Molossus molossus TaxID=27622 RepID=A0A7J8DUD3_MOLMO|nr:hypothetical protein HJG59_009182 [Molossus molossus]
MFPKENMHLVMSNLYRIPLSTCSTQPSSPRSRVTAGVRVPSDNTRPRLAKRWTPSAEATIFQSSGSRIFHCLAWKQSSLSNKRLPCRCQDRGKSASNSAAHVTPRLSTQRLTSRHSLRAGEQPWAFFEGPGARSRVSAQVLPGATRSLSSRRCRSGSASPSTGSATAPPGIFSTRCCLSRSFSFSRYSLYRWVNRGSVTTATTAAGSPPPRRVAGPAFSPMPSARVPLCSESAQLHGYIAGRRRTTGARAAVPAAEVTSNWPPEPTDISAPATVASPWGSRGCRRGCGRPLLASP